MGLVRCKNRRKKYLIKGPLEWEALICCPRKKVADRKYLEQIIRAGEPSTRLNFSDAFKSFP